MALKKRHLVLCAVAVLACTSLLLSAVSSFAPLTAPSSPSSNVAWLTRTSHADADDGIERSLRRATDAMNLVRLRDAIAAAKAASHQSLALRTAEFVHSHLSEEHTRELTAVAAEVGAVTTTVASSTAAASTVGSTTVDKQVVPVVPAGTFQPRVFDWWSNPPAPLAPLLPSVEKADIFLELPEEEESRVQQRHEALLDLVGPRFAPSSFPIGIVAYNRPELLKLCLASLLAVRGVVPGQVTLYQDGTDQAVRRVAEEAGIGVKQHLGNRNQVGQEGAAQIARHYKWTFSMLFDDHPSAEYAIIVEDDMVFAPDFLSYFSQLAPLYDADPSVYCITSWNDNAQAGLARDPRIMLRTDFFIGLGWMISRKIYKGELESKWPATHWDHWLRMPQQRRDRQCIYPEVPRNFNIGKHGTHSDDNMYAEFFQRIVLNKQAAVWLGDTSRLLASNYDASLLSRLRNSVQLSSPADLSRYEHTDVTLFLSMLSLEDKRWETSYAPYFGLWHSIPNIRGIYHESVVHMRWRTNYVFLVLSHMPSFAKLRNATTTPLLGAKAFKIEIDRFTIVVAEPGGENCHAACGRAGTPTQPKFCSRSGLARINDCDVMQSHFECKRCEANVGVDQPAFVHKSPHPNEGLCLVNSKEPDCSGGHADTTRLCACF